jgi:hypothetical protein
MQGDLVLFLIVLAQVTANIWLGIFLNYVVRRVTRAGAFVLCRHYCHTPATCRR